MWPVVPAHETLVVIGIMILVLTIAARLLQPAWWRSRAVRVATFAAFGAMVAGVALWQIGHAVGNLGAVHAGAGMAYVGILVLAPAVVVMPVAAVVDRGVMKVVDAGMAPREGRVSRRGLLRAIPAALPAAAAISGASGLVAARLEPRLRVIPMRYENLHPDLDGLRILQLSDLHLGACASLDDLENALERAMAAQRPDLIVLTGDLADDPGLIPGALDLVARAGARHGALASLGNHEYLHGIGVTRPKYEASRVPLLVSAGRTLRIGRAKLFVGGADDPVHMGGDIAWILTPSIEKAAAQAPTDADFRLLLCHRPEGFGPAAAAGFDLTLSGHTHGGQLGLFGRSLLEKLRPGTDWWGTYARARPDRPAVRGTRPTSSPSRLYTTSGFGHWFPFRLGCPTEMPVVVLERSAVGPSGMTSLSRRV
jgi:predicted MPP superfamily phosphohydrolase